MIPRTTQVPQAENIYLDFSVELQIRGFEGEISSAYSDRTALATDNSIYQVLPQLTVFPKGTDDLARVTQVAAQDKFQKIKLYPRGGGTGTNGQSLGDGVVIDISRHMNKILEINPVERWARVQAGVVKDQLEAALRPYNLFFAPELSTSNRATIGGMVNTDASGQGSCLYGKTRDHVLKLTTVLLDGTVWESEPISDEELADIQQKNTFVGNIYRTIDRIQKENSELIDKYFPKLNRSLTGYDLAHIRNTEGRFDLNSILCGAEGSLAFITEAKINLIPIPKYSALLAVSYASFDAALRDAPRLLKLQATSIETIDSVVLQLARGDNTWRAISKFFPTDSALLGGVNLVEFTADDFATLEITLTRATTLLDDSSTSPGVWGYTLTQDPSEIEQIWNMRKRSVGLLGRMKGERRPIPFVEDTAVPPENLADYIADFRQLLDNHGLKYGMFGHADAGVLHVRPAIDMKDPDQEKLIRVITDELVKLVHKYHGVLWGEHGKGLRSEYAPKFFGPLYPRLQEIKEAFDPKNQLNPGKIAAPRGSELIRLDRVSTRGQHDRVIPIAVRKVFSDALHCNGNGACFNFDPDDAMCPSWKGSRDRRFSPKGRASLLREWLRLIAASGHFDKAGQNTPSSWRIPRSLLLKVRNSIGKYMGEYDFSHEVLESMDSCLACKSCTGQCPIKVDIPKQRSKFLEMYYTRYMRPPKDLVLGVLEQMLPLLAKATRPVNIAMGSLLFRWLLKKINLAQIPLLSKTPLLDSIRREGFSLASEKSIENLQEKKSRALIIVQDAFTSHFESELVMDALRFLRVLGYIPLVAPYLPNGKALQVRGLSKRFKSVAKCNLEMLKILADKDIPLVGIDPAITLTYRSEYTDTFPEERVPAVLLIQEWLSESLSNRKDFTGPFPETREAEIYYLMGHCTEKTNAPAAMDQWVDIFNYLGLKLEIVPTGCCGMAGTFGHEVSNRNLSEDIYKQSWGPAVVKHQDGKRLMATGYSCRCQTKIIDSVVLPHPLQVLLRQSSK